MFLIWELSSIIGMVEVLFFCEILLLLVKYDIWIICIIFLWILILFIFKIYYENIKMEYVLNIIIILKLGEIMLILYNYSRVKCVFK